MSFKQFLLLALSVSYLFACGSDPDSPAGFSLPEGDANQGDVVFRKYECLACHNLTGVEDPTINKEFDQPVVLGGTTSKVKTYAQLVTAIINPSHKIAPRAPRFEPVVNEDGSSKMRIYNDVMTVSELIDLVAFLQPQYKVKPIQYTPYHSYHIP